MWVLYSILAALLWGLDYCLTEKVIKKVQFSSLLTIELFFGFIAMLALTLLSDAHKTDWHTFLASKQTMLFTLIIVASFNVANVLIVLSIGNMNATLAGLVEVSYPLFIALFSWLFFGEARLNAGTALGGALILLGVSLIYFFMNK